MKDCQTFSNKLPYKTSFMTRDECHIIVSTMGNAFTVKPGDLPVGTGEQEDRLNWPSSG